MQIIPLQAVPNQKFQVVLADQSCQIEINQTDYGLFTTLWLGDDLVIAGVLSLNATRIVRSAYLGFVGDLAFQDLDGSENPIYTGLGTRFVLNYLEESDLS